jgi:hypothetical protein
MSGKGKTKNHSEDAAPSAPGSEDPLEDAVEDALEQDYARRMLEIDVEAPKGESKKRARVSKKLAANKARTRKPPQLKGK